MLTTLSIASVLYSVIKRLTLASRFRDSCKRDSQPNKQRARFAMGAGLLCLAAASPSQACSVFSARNSQNQALVAKNFDWMSGEGYLVENPRGILRTSFTDLHRRWKSQYGSLSFTVLGPGLPVSGMNENGLVVEALVDFDSELDPADSKVGLLSLEWAQYVLDNFQTTQDVAVFAKENPYQQIVVPLHFFVCDRSGDCAVFERSADKSLKITAGSELKAPVLANRSWSNDYKPHSSLFQRLMGQIDPRGAASSTRFRTLMRESEKQAGKIETNSAFKSLEKSKIPGINQWQIVWNPQEQSVDWKLKHAGASAKVSSLNLKNLNFHCRTQKTVSDLGKKLEMRDYQESDLDLVTRRAEDIIRWRLGKSDQTLARAIARYTMMATCDDRNNRASDVAQKK